MAASTVVTDYLAHGSLASRPASLSLASGAIGIYFADDTGDTYAWTGAAWHKIDVGTSAAAGLYANTLSSTPTSSGTSLTTWQNQGGATVADATNGILITAPTNSGDSWRLRTKAAPSTPYTISALVSLEEVATTVFGGIGFTDGTKLHMIALGWAGGGSGFNQGLGVMKWTNATTFSAYDFGANGNGLGMKQFWLQIRDDGTNVKFRAGSFGSNGNNADLIEYFSIAKVSGFLGASGYTNVCIGIDNNASGANALLGVQSWSVST